MLQTFCEGPNNGGPSLAKFHEGWVSRTLAESTPMYVSQALHLSTDAFVKERSEPVPKFNVDTDINAKTIENTEIQPAEVHKKTC